MAKDKDMAKRRSRIIVSVFLIILVALIIIRLLPAMLSAYAPASLNTVSLSAGVQLITHHADRKMIHPCESSTGWTNSTSQNMSFSSDGENKTQGQFSLDVLINFTDTPSVAVFINDDDVDSDVSGADFLDFYIRANSTLGNLYLVLYDSTGFNMYWNFEPATAVYDDFTLFQLDMEDASFEHALFNRADIDIVGFQMAGVAIVHIWIDSISVSSFQHTYSPSYSDSYRNITLDDEGVLGLSKETDAYTISCSTEDRISISLSRWFYGGNFRTTFRPTSQVASSLSFSVFTGGRGEPAQITGVSSWTFSDETSILSLTCGSGSRVSFFFYSTAESQTVWIIENIPLWMGLAGFGMMVFSPSVAVLLFKEGDWEHGLLVLMFGLALGMCFIIGWLWG